VPTGPLSPLYCFPSCGCTEHRYRRPHKREVRHGPSEESEMSTAFVLIKTRPQMEAVVFRALLALDNVVETHVVYGEYDLAARIDFSDDKEMSRILIGEFRSIEGVEKTETLIAAEV